MRAQKESGSDAAHRIVGHHGRCPWLFSGNPKAEVLSQEAFDAMTRALPEGVRPASVTLWETPTAASEYRGDDRD